MMEYPLTVSPPGSQWRWGRSGDAWKPPLEDEEYAGNSQGNSLRPTSGPHQTPRRGWGCAALTTGALV